MKKRVVLNKLSEVIKKFEAKECLVFKPNKEFYKKVGIPQKRFWQLVRNEADITVREVVVIAEHFKVEISQIFDVSVPVGLYPSDSIMKEKTNDKKAEKTPKQEEDFDWIPKSEAMKMLRIKSATTMNKLIEGGKMKEKHLGRKPFISKASIKAYLDGEKRA